MKPGQRIRVPVEMLANRFKPLESPERREYEEVVLEARRLKGQQVHSRGLEGIVVVLDPGHGGRDHGAIATDYCLFEDELNYDIAVRVKRILESQTRAKMHITMWDPNQDFEPTSNRRFVHDTDEQLLTNPRYFNSADRETDAIVSANLRWCMANTIYARERAKGTDPRKIVFTSFHCDALFNSRLRGTMVYIPGASLRENRTCSGPTYAKYQEVKEGGRSRSTVAERRRDEALSRNFAEALLDELGKKRIRRHQEGDPIRSQIRKSPRSVYVPAVLKNNMIPTKVLVEAANLTNPTDCRRLADPQWRQAFAEAYVAALRRYYDDDTATVAEGSTPAWAEEEASDGAKTALNLPPVKLAPARAKSTPPAKNTKGTVPSKGARRGSNRKDR
jgi:N-acetylmuramoyl-L-alanine amidase